MMTHAGAGRPVFVGGLGCQKTDPPHHAWAQQVAIKQPAAEALRGEVAWGVACQGQEVLGSVSAVHVLSSVWLLGIVSNDYPCGSRSPCFHGWPGMSEDRPPPIHAWAQEVAIRQSAAETPRGRSPP